MFARTHGTHVGWHFVCLSLSTTRIAHGYSLGRCQSLHREAFTQKTWTQSCYTEEPLHRTAFTDRGFYTQKLLHREVFTQRSLYTAQLLHIDIEAFT